MYPLSTDVPNHRLGWYCRKRIRNYATNDNRTGVRLQITHLIRLARPRRLGVWVIQMLRAAPVEKPATAGALMNSTLMGTLGEWDIRAGLSTYNPTQS